MSILVAGGGIGGLGAALALARAGHAVELFERTTGFRELGAGIQLGPNVFAMFDRLGISDAILADAVQPEALVMRCAVHGHEIIRVPLGQAMRARFGNPYAVTHRADLHATLLRACQVQPGITLQTGRTVAGFTQDAASVTLRFEDGEAATGTALIAADGLWSRIRQQMLGDGPPTVSGHIAYRAVLPMAEVPPDLRENRVILWAGPRLHLVTYPLRHGAVMNLVAVFHSDHTAEGWDQPGDTTLLTRHFADTRLEVRALLARIDAWKFWVLCDRDPRRGWAQGRVALLGDAAHPMLQYLAQGANMALEDSVCLADQLAMHTDIPTALAAYEDLRVLRTGRLQVMARVYGEIYHAAGVRAELRDAMLRDRDPAAAAEGMAWLYDKPVWPGAPD